MFHKAKYKNALKVNSPHLNMLIYVGLNDQPQNHEFPVVVIGSHLNNFSMPKIIGRNGRVNNGINIIVFSIILLIDTLQVAEKHNAP